MDKKYSIQIDKDTTINCEFKYIDIDDLNTSSKDVYNIIVNKLGPADAPTKFDTTVEDINKDGSSIYMTSTQAIFLEDINSFPLKSFGNNIDPVSQPVLQIPRKPILTEITSPSEQDKNATQ